jgi:hypothetical protein
MGNSKTGHGPLPVQLDLLGGPPAPPQDLDLRDKVAYILEAHPEARDDDAALLFWYWVTWDGLGQLLGAEALEKLERFMVRATSAETVRRRRQEIQKNRSKAGAQLPSRGVAEWRRARDGAGPPRRRR